MAAPIEKVTLDVEVVREDDLWVARQPDFGLVAAHPSVNGVLFRIFNMAVSQLTYALNHDKDLSNLTSNADDELAEQLRGLRATGSPFTLLVRALKLGALLELPVAIPR